MNVKVQGLLNAAKYIEERFGRDALAGIVRACSPRVRETYSSSIAINWHPVDELCEFVEVAEARLGCGRGKLAQDIGAAGARANMKGVLLRLAFYMAKPAFLMQRIASMWQQFNDEGEMELVHIDARVARIEVRGIGQPRATFCAILCGWCHEVSVALGAKPISVQHVECAAQGGRRCVFEIRGYYAGAKEPETPPSSGPRA